MKLAGCVRGPARALARRARTVKSCGPDAPCWRQVVRRCRRAQPGSNASSIRKATVAKVLGSPRRSRIRRNPSRRESRMIRFTCGLLVRSLCARPRVPSAPGFPCALFSQGGETDAYLGRIAPRERGHMFGVIGRRSRFLPSPLVGEGGAKRHEWLHPRRQTPHPCRDAARRVTTRRASFARVRAPTRGVGEGDHPQSLPHISKSIRCGISGMSAGGIW